MGIIIGARIQILSLLSSRVLIGLLVRYSNQQDRSSNFSSRAAFEELPSVCAGRRRKRGVKVSLESFSLAWWPGAPQISEYHMILRILDGDRELWFCSGGGDCAGGRDGGWLCLHICSQVVWFNFWISPKSTFEFFMQLKQNGKLWWSDQAWGRKRR